MRIRYDSTAPRHKTPFGALIPGQLCRIEIHIPRSVPVAGVFLLLEQDGGQARQLTLGQASGEEDYLFYGLEFSLPEPGLYFYHFRVEKPDSCFSLYRQGLRETNMEAGGRWQITCVPGDYRVPEDFRGAVMYQIFPDRFVKSGDCDLTEKLTPYRIHGDFSEIPDYLPDEKGEILNCDFYGGNFRGIREKLPYLKGLGVRVLYLNPIFMAWSNHRYDTADYLRPDPMLGTEEDFKSLCDAAHELGMKILLDGVFSHTGVRSRYFEEARRDPDSPYRAWYRFTRWPEEYESWWGIRTLPAVDELNESYLDFILRAPDSVVSKWLGLGADGFRLDVADELPGEFIALLHRTVKELKPETLVLGEVWEDASSKMSYSERRRYFTAPELDAVTNYPFRRAILDFALGADDGRGLEETVMTLAENYPKGALDCSMTLLSTHDTVRALTVLGADETPETRRERAEHRLSPEKRVKAIKRLKTAAFLQFTLPGAPCIYYGDEAGMEGFEDPFNRRFYPWDGEDRDLVDFYRGLGLLRESNPALQTGDIRFLEAENGLVRFSRTLDGQTVTVCVNARTGERSLG